MVENEELNDLYSTHTHTHNIVRVIKSRIMRWVGHVARMGERRGVYRVLVGKPERERPLGRPRRRWGIILRWIFMKLDGGTDWIDLAQDRDSWSARVYAVMDLRVP